MAEAAIAVVTSGGDAPGMNAAIATIVKAAESRNVTPRDVAVLGVRRGYHGLKADGDFVSLKLHSVAGILRKSGTILGSSRLPELKDKAKFREWAENAVRVLRRKCVRGMIVLGGDGSFRCARKLYKFCKKTGYPISIVGIPSSIDNDIPGTDYALGSDTAVNTTMRVLDSLVGTAYSHGRTFLVETMGARAGYLALMAALTGECEAVYLPEDGNAGPSWRSDLYDELKAQFRPFQAAPEDPQALWLRKNQATVVFAEEFSRQHEQLSTSTDGDFQKLVAAIEHRLSDTTLRDADRAVLEKERKDVEVLRLRAEPSRTEKFLALADKNYPTDPAVLPLEVRSSVPGHIVRGEPPTAGDRILACRLALRAVQCIVGCWEYDSRVSEDKHPDMQHMEKGNGLMVGIRGDEVRPVYLNRVIRRVHQLHGCVASERRFFFQQPRQLIRVLGAPAKSLTPADGGTQRRLGIMTAGADAPGMNAAIRAVVRVAIANGIEPWGIRNGFVGLERAGEGKTKEPLDWTEEEFQLMGLPDALTRINLLEALNRGYLARFGPTDRLELTPEIIETMRCVQDVRLPLDLRAEDVMAWALREGAYIFPLDWMRVNNIGKLPGSILGSIRSGGFLDEDSIRSGGFSEEDFVRMAAKLKALSIAGLVVIGGLNELALAHKFSRVTRVPVIAIPATIDNDIPGTHYSIGADTALNTICQAADQVMATAAATYRVFVIDVMGRLCGYLAFMGAIAGAAEAVLIPEHPFSLGQIHEVAEHLRKGFRQRRRHGVVICEENAAQEMKPAQVCDAIATAGRGFFETRFVQLGHVQRGGIPTAFDRELGSRMGQAAVEAVVKFDTSGGAAMVAIEPGDEPVHNPNDTDQEGWRITTRDLQEVLLPSKLYRDELETSKDWWNEHEFPDLQRVVTGPPHYTDGLDSKPAERYHRPLAF